MGDGIIIANAFEIGMVLLREWDDEGRGGGGGGGGGGKDVVDDVDAVLDRSSRTIVVAFAFAFVVVVVVVDVVVVVVVRAVPPPDGLIPSLDDFPPCFRTMDGRVNMWDDDGRGGAGGAF